MPSRSKKGITMAKLNREARLRERRSDKAARKQARREAGPESTPENPPRDESAEGHSGAPEERE